MQDESYLTKKYFPKENHIQSICESITNDQHIYRWFLCLITTPETIQTGIYDQQTVQQLSSVSRRHILLYGITTIYVLFLLAFKSFILLPTVLLPIIITKLAFNQKRRLVRSMGNKIIEFDFDENQFDQKTIFQIGEHYSKKYNIPSLVDTTLKTDIIMQKTILYAFAIAACMLPFIHIWKIYYLLFLAPFFATLYSNSTAVYKNK